MLGVNMERSYLIILILGLLRLGSIASIAFANPTNDDLITENDHQPSFSIHGLHEAVERGDKDMFQSLLAEKWLNLNSLNSQNETALQLACKYGHLEIVELLISKLEGNISKLKEIVDARQPVTGWTALFFAVNSSSSNAAEIVHKLLFLGSADWRFRDSLGLLSFHLAIIKNQSEAMISDFLKKDSSLAYNSSCCGGKTPSHLAAEYNVVGYRPDYFNADAVDAVGQTPSCYAALSGAVEFAELILEAGRKFNPLEGNCFYGSTSKLRETPLHVAVYNRQLRYLKFLLSQLDNHANLLSYRDEKDGTLMHALARSFELPEEAFQRGADYRELAALLYKTSEPIAEAPNSEGITPFLAAIRSSAPDFAEYLRIKCVAKVLVADSRGYLAPHLARDPETFGYLQNMVKPGLFTDINLRTVNPSEQFTPLQVAILECKPIGFIKYLLNHRADPTITDMLWGSTALQMAVVKNYTAAVEEMLSRDDLPSCKLMLSMRDTANNLTPLLTAIKLGHNEIASKIIKSKEFTAEMLEKEVVSEDDGKVETAIHLAAELDRGLIVEAMIDRFYSSSTGPKWMLNAKRQTFLHKAIDHESVEDVRVATEKIDVEILKKAVLIQDKHGRTVIHSLSTKCSSKSIEIARTLAKKPLFEHVEQVRNIFGETPVETAVKINCIQMVELLLQIGSPDQCATKHGHQGLTVLHEAKLFGYDQLVSAMVATGKCSLEQIDIRHRTVKEVEAEREIAEDKDRLETAKRELQTLKKQLNSAFRLSLKNGVFTGEYTELTSKLAFTCNQGFKTQGNAVASWNSNQNRWNLEGSCYKNDPWLDESLFEAAKNGSLEIAKSLLDKGANFEKKTYYGLTALHIAAHYGQVEIARLLLDGGAKVDERDHDQWTSLHFASYFGDSGVARLLLDRGANINAISNDGKTPLIIAAGGSKFEVVKLLVEQGADINVVSSSECTQSCMCKSSTALMCAAERNSPSIVQYLLSTGASRQR